MVLVQLVAETLKHGRILVPDYWHRLLLPVRLFMTAILWLLLHSIVVTLLSGHLDSVCSAAMQG